MKSKYTSLMRRGIQLMTKKTKRIVERAGEYVEQGYTVFEAVRRAQKEIEQEEKEAEKR